MKEFIKEPKSHKKLYIILWCCAVFPILFAIILFALISSGKLGFMPTFEELENPKTKLATNIISADGKTMGTFFKENRIECKYEDLPPYLVDALVCTEDARFYKHSGIDYRGLIRVGVKTVLGGDKNSGGGSTITQQLAKMLFPREKLDSKTDLIFRKLREWAIAVKLEKSYTKEEIITLYLNKFDFLHNADGIKMASQVYFSKEPKELTIEEAAMLVGQLKNPALFNPLRNVDTVTVRRNVVLSQMVRYGKLSEEAYDSLKNIPIILNFKRIDHTNGIAPYFREWLRMTMTAQKPEKQNYWSYDMYQRDSTLWETSALYGWCNKNEKTPGVYYNLYSDGLKIYTTIDSRMQKYGEDAMRKHMSETVQPAFFRENKNNSKAPFASNLSKDEYDTRIKASIQQSERYRSMGGKSMSWDEVMQIFKEPVSTTIFSWNGPIDTIISPLDSLKWMKSFLQCGMLSMEAHTGYVRAFVGGIDYEYFQYDHIMQQKRQVGSTFKPFLYTLAMQEGMSPCKQFANVPTSFYVNDQMWTPSNSDKARNGEMVSLAWGLATSNNWISAKLMQLLKPEPVVALAHEMGLYSHIDPVPSICLGVADLTLHEMVGAYSTFPNKGIHVEPILVTKIEDKYGNVIATFSTKQNEAISEEVAYQMVGLLQNVVNMVDREAKAYGTAISLRTRYDIRVPLAGKTGTTNDHADGWFMGFTPELVTGVWVGGDEPSIRFRSFANGQGARMAMPIFAYYIKDCIAHKDELGYKFGDFEKPLNWESPCYGVSPTPKKSDVNANDFDDFL
jgi:penicillin-binding protein 1A